MSWTPRRPFTANAKAVTCPAERCGSPRDPSNVRVAIIAGNKGEDEGRLSRERQGYFSDRLC
jgi:hypothetical protein